MKFRIQCGCGVRAPMLEVLRCWWGRRSWRGRSLALLVTLLWLLPAFARAESDPFALPHPTTGEPGVWIPPWVQKIHLETDAALKTCNLERDALTLRSSENAAELSARSAAIAELQQSIAALNTQLIAEDLRAQEAEDTSKNRMIWALTTTSGVVVATIVIVLQAVL